MNAITTPKDAAVSTPAVSPAGSLPEEQPGLAAATPEQGADAEITAADIAVAMGQLSEGPTPDETDTPETDAPGETPAAEATDEAEPPGASGGEAAPGDGTAEDPGSVDEPEAPEAPEAPAGEEPAKEPTPAERRINELVARAKAAEEREAQARERLSAVEARAAGLLDEDPLAHIDDPNVLAAHRQKLVALQSKALANPDGFRLPDGKGGEIEFDREAVARISAQTFAALQNDIPRRAAYLQQRGVAEQAAASYYPWVKDTTQGEGQFLQRAIEALPQLRSVPNYRLIAADALMGMRLREAGVKLDARLLHRLQSETAAKPAAVPKKPALPVRPPPPAPARAGIVPPRVPPKAAAGVAADKRLRKGDGNINDLTASIAASLG